MLCWFIKPMLRYFTIARGTDHSNGQGITKDSMLHPLGTMNFCTQFHVNRSYSCRDFWVLTEVTDCPTDPCRLHGLKIKDPPKAASLRSPLGSDRWYFFISCAQDNYLVEPSYYLVHTKQLSFAHKKYHHWDLRGSVPISLVWYEHCCSTQCYSEALCVNILVNPTVYVHGSGAAPHKGSWAFMLARHSSLYVAMVMIQATWTHQFCMCHALLRKGKRL